VTRAARIWAIATAAIVVLLFATPASAMPQQVTAPNGKPTAHAVITHVGPTEWALIKSTGTWHPGCPGGRLTFRRVTVNFHGFDGKVHRGVLIVNRDVASSVARVMTTLFNDGFLIHRMHPIEVYRGDDNRSMRADNTSAMNCRNAAQANAPAKDSPHANGRAIDINPWENPWVDPRCGCFRPDKKFGSLRHGAGVITPKGAVVRAFHAEGWIWRGTGKNPDLQHFDTGYPSRPPRS
jgi:D-alanyl-D-alanine carboxypeptidase